MFFIEGIISGVIATIIFDIYQLSLSYAYNIKKPNWSIAGRYFAGLKYKKFYRSNLENDPPINNELIIGYFGHYFIGIIYGLTYVILNTIFYEEPSLIFALLIGFITVLGAWCVMMPFAYNIGFFASQKEEQKQIMVQNLLAHFVFGIGLYIGYIFF